jgi:release factor glutamine methyltransferase
LQPVFNRLYGYYTSKKRHYRFKGIEVVVYPGVFQPRFTYSTKYLLEFINELSLNQKSLLELGCGSGLISLHAAARGAQVTATDINPDALEGLRESQKLNGLTVNILHSDLFENVSPEDYDIIIINPPYYPKKPLNVKEQAWYCGEDFQYFRRLFRQLAHTPADIFMILSEDCQIEDISAIAENSGWTLLIKSEKHIMNEVNYIFQVKKAL